MLRRNTGGGAVHVVAAVAVAAPGPLFFRCPIGETFLKPIVPSGDNVLRLLSTATLPSGHPGVAEVGACGGAPWIHRSLAMVRGDAHGKKLLGMSPSHRCGQCSVSGNSSGCGLAEMWFCISSWAVCRNHRKQTQKIPPPP